MKRIYYAFLPLTYKREGGVWWFKDLDDREVADWVKTMKPVCSAVRLTDEFAQHSMRDIYPPASAEVLK